MSTRVIPPLRRGRLIGPREPAIDPKDLMRREYEQSYIEIRGFRENYLKLEQYAVAGVAAAYAFLFTHPELPKIVWWVVPFLVALVAVRCFALYWIINFKCARQIERIEQVLYDGKFRGLQTLHTDEFPGRLSNLAFNGVVWGSLLVLTLSIAIWH